MRAVVIRSFGGPEVLETAEVPSPAPGPGQVLIRVEAAAVNPVDLMTRSGVLAEAGVMPRREQTGLGWDVAGVVARAGAGAPFPEGARVIGLRAGLDVPAGAYAEEVVLDAAAVAPAPEGRSAAEAATLPLNGLTAWQALGLLGLPAGETLLVTGAAGGVGGFAVELAAARGLRVVAVAGGADEELVRGFGAEFFVAREAAGEGLAAAVRAAVPGGVAGALDTAMAGPSAVASVRDGGTLVAVNAPAPEGERDVRVVNVWVTPDGDALAELSALAAAGRLTLRVAETLPLERAATAHERLAKGGVRGRLVLLP